MSEIKVSELPEASSMANNDLLMIVQNNTNKKIKKGNVGIGDGIPTGSVIGFDGDTIPGGFEEVVTENKLYSDETGTTGDIILIGNINNYDAYEIIYYVEFAGQRVYSTTGRLPYLTYLRDGADEPSTGRIHLSSFFIATGQALRVYNKRIAIYNGNQLSVVSDRYFATDGGSGEGQYTYITEIIGYKEA